MERLVRLLLAQKLFVDWKDKNRRFYSLALSAASPAIIGMDHSLLNPSIKLFKIARLRLI